MTHAPTAPQAGLEKTMKKGRLSSLICALLLYPIAAAAWLARSTRMQQSSIGQS